MIRDILNGHSILHYRDYSTAKGHIVDATGHGDFITIEAAVSAAVSGQTIFLRPGTYTPSGGVLNLKGGVNILTLTEEDSTPNVTLIGKVLLSTGGNVTLGNFRISNSGDYAVQVTGSDPSSLICKNVDLVLNDFDGINITNSSAGVSFDDSITEFVGGNLKHWVTTAGNLDFVFCQTGGSPPAPPGISTTTNGSVVYFFCTNGVPASVNGSGGVSYFWTYTDVSTNNQTVLTLAGTSSSRIYYSSFQTGTAVALSVGAGCTMSLAAPMIATSNANAIDGAGTLFYSNITFNGTGVGIATATQNPITMKPYSTAGTTVTGVRGTSAFDSTQFTVTDGFVQLSGGAGTNWTDISGAFGAVSNNGYFLTAASTPTLPAAPGQGAIVQFVCDTGATVTVTANAGQRIRVGAVLSAVAGTTVSNAQGNALTLVFRNATSTWHAIDAPEGTWVTT